MPSPEFRDEEKSQAARRCGIPFEGFWTDGRAAGSGSGTRRCRAENSRTKKGGQGRRLPGATLSSHRGGGDGLLMSGGNPGLQGSAARNSRTKKGRIEVAGCPAVWGSFWSDFEGLLMCSRRTRGLLDFSGGSGARKSRTDGDGLGVPPVGFVGGGRRRSADWEGTRGVGASVTRSFAGLGPWAVGCGRGLRQLLLRFPVHPVNRPQTRFRRSACMSEIGVHIGMV